MDGSEFVLGEVHELLGVGGPVVGRIVRLVKNDMTGCFDLTSDGVFKFDDAVGGGVTEECARGSVCRVNFVTAYSRLLDCNMASKHT